MGKLNVTPRTIFCRDNLEVLSGINSECVDLVYLDPPFNKKKKFTAPIGSSAEGAEFSDIFLEKDIKDEWVDDIRYENPELHEYLRGVQTFGNRYNYCYLVYMAARLMHCHRVLKNSGSIYLHCDMTMSHYLKIVMDCIFGERNFRTEVIWCYHGPGSPKMRQFNRKTDTLLWYSKGASWTFNADAVRVPFKDPKQSLRRAMAPDGEFTPEEVEAYRRRGKVPENWWEIRIASRSKWEYMGFPTQKPLALLERIIRACSNEDDLLLDPFCGCATSCVAAERLGRRWIGVDVSYKAFELIQKRLRYQVPPDLLREEANFTTTAPVRGEDDVDAGGYVYVIGNPAWRGMHKVGIAKNVQRRLAAFQTSDPHRRYQVVHQTRTPHYKEIEKLVHARFNSDHEWVFADAADIIAAITQAAQRLG